jgi:ComF family protein
MLFSSGSSILNYCAAIRQRALPPLCLLCATPAGATNLCEPCRLELPYLAPERCPRCAEPDTSGQVCGACLAHPPEFDRAVAPCAYSYPLDRVIQAFKYSGKLAAAPMLAGLMLTSIETEPRPDLIIPMPLSRERLRERGFNQSMELARLISIALGVELAPQACIRVQHGTAQSALPWTERAKNIRGAFVCMQDLAGRSVAVVDDVLTTGATLNELSRVLRKRGAERVSGWVAARTISHSA